MLRHRLPLPLAGLLGLTLLASGCSPGASPASGAKGGGRRGSSRSAPVRPSTALPAQKTGTLQVAFLDVGQGDGALLRGPAGETMLIDAGPPEAGERVVEVLKASEVPRLDWIVGSHPHADHIGGLVDVLRAVPVSQALDPGYNHGTALQKTYLSLLKEKGVKTSRARKGQTYQLGKDVRVEILAPEEPLLKGTDSDPNNNSIVARVVYGSTRFLFTGDMEEPERERLLASAGPEALRAEVLKVAHHGSHNGTDPAWLAAVKPKYGVISVAAKNDYGHPHQEALDALRAAKVEILRTDERGDIVFSSDGKTLTLQRGEETERPSTPPRPAAGGGKPAPSTGTAYQGRVIGNSASHVFHAPTCDRLPRSERRVEFASVAEAEKAGYRPHRACLPAR